MKKLLVGMLGIILALSVTGCGSKTSSEVTAEPETKGNGTVFECFEQINSDDTLEEMNEVIGFDGELTSDDDSFQTYVWDLSEDTSITAQFFLSSNTATITAEFPNSYIKKDANFSRFDEIGDALDNGEDVSYEQFVELVGGIEGVATKKTSRDITYKWLNSDGGYLNAYFDSETGMCTMATGYF